MRKFTLIELLVVISIIGILTSILLPSLSKARDMGQTAVCASNQKQIGVAVVSYIGEYDGIFPFGMTNDVATWTGTPNTDSQPPQQVLFNFVGESKRVFTCPTDPSPEDFKWWQLQNHPDLDGASYGFNEWSAWFYTANNKKAFKMTLLSTPTDWVMMSDYYHTVSGGGGSWLYSPLATNPELTGTIQIPESTCSLEMVMSNWKMPSLDLPVI